MRGLIFSAPEQFTIAQGASASAPFGYFSP